MIPPNWSEDVDRMCRSFTKSEVAALKRGESIAVVLQGKTHQAKMTGPDTLTLDTPLTWHYEEEKP